MYRQTLFVLLFCITFDTSRCTDDSNSIQNTFKKFNETLHKLPVEFDTFVDDVKEELNEVWSKYHSFIIIIAILSKNIFRYRQMRLSIKSLL